MTVAVRSDDEDAVRSPPCRGDRGVAISPFGNRHRASSRIPLRRPCPDVSRCRSRSPMGDSLMLDSAVRECDEYVAPGTASVIPPTKTQAAVPDETLAHALTRSDSGWSYGVVRRCLVSSGSGTRSIIRLVPLLGPEDDLAAGVAAFEFGVSLADLRQRVDVRDRDFEVSVGDQGGQLGEYLGARPGLCPSVGLHPVLRCRCEIGDGVDPFGR